MAPCSSSRQVVAALMVVAAAALLAPGVNGFDTCPSTNKLVYPFAARCGQDVAVYYGKEVYELGVLSLIGSIQGYLAPEWDETNSTFYVRSAQVGAKYEFTHHTRELRDTVSQSDDVIIFNSETGRALGWRREGDNEWFLVEVERGTLSSDNFRFAKAPHTSMVLCRFVEPITCEFYFLLKFGTSLGVSPYVEDDVTYFKLSHISTLPLSTSQSFGLFRSRSSLDTPNAIS